MLQPSTSLPIQHRGSSIVQVQLNYFNFLCSIKIFNLKICVFETENRFKRIPANKYITAVTKIYLFIKAEITRLQRNEIKDDLTIFVQLTEISQVNQFLSRMWPWPHLHSVLPFLMWVIWWYYYIIYGKISLIIHVIFLKWYF